MSWLRTEPHHALIHPGGRDFEQALLALNKIGYTVDAIMLNAIHWTPQSRPRLFVLAKRDDGQGTRSCAIASDARPEALFDFINEHPNIRWDIRDLPPLPLPRARLADIIEDLPDDDPHWWNKKRTEYFMNQMSAKHKKQAREMIGGKSFSYATAFCRGRHEKRMAELRIDGVAGALRSRRGVMAGVKSAECITSRQGVRRLGHEASPLLPDTDACLRSRARKATNSAPRYRG